MNEDEKGSHDFRTLTGYRLKSNKEITDSMEDYLEMICRYSIIDGYARINSIAAKLNVTPSSASKMISNLKQLGYADYEKYSVIKLSHKGWAIGKYLLHRHDILNEFLCLLNCTEDETVQVEQIEHFFEEKTIENLEKFLLANKSRLKGQDSQFF